MTTTPLDLDALEAAISAMTCPAPWRKAKHADEPCFLDARNWDFGFEFPEEDRDAIIALRNSAPALFAAARERDNLRDEVNGWRHILPEPEAVSLRAEIAALLDTLRYLAKEYSRNGRIDDINMSHVWKAIGEEG